MDKIKWNCLANRLRRHVRLTLPNYRVLKSPLSALLANMTVTSLLNSAPAPVNPSLDTIQATLDTHCRHITDVETGLSDHSDGIVALEKAWNKLTMANGQPNGQTGWLGQLLAASQRTWKIRAWGEQTPQVETGPRAFHSYRDEERVFGRRVSGDTRFHSTWTSVSVCPKNSLHPAFDGQTFYFDSASSAQAFYDSHCVCDWRST